MGIRTKFITYTILVVLFPIAVTIIVFLALVGPIIQNAEENSSIETDFYLMEEAIRDNYDQIGNPSQYYESIRPYLDKYGLEIQIETIQGEEQINSEEFGSTPTIEKESSIFDRFNTYSVSIFEDDEKVAMATLKGTSGSSSVFSVYGKIVSAGLISLLSGFLTFLLMMAILTIYMSRHVLTPMEQLGNATQLIAEGDYTYNLPYVRNNEIGKLTQAFLRMRQKLADNIREIQEHEQSRKELVASISHDLRTPLASIQGYVEALQDGVATDPETKKKYLETIKTKTIQVNRLIDDLFEFSKLELEQLPMTMQTMNSSFLAEILIQMESDIKRLGARADIDLNIPSVLIRLDPERMIQVIQNIVNNALRYIDKSSGLIEMSALVQNQHFVIKIKDNGTGIKEEDLPHIFDRFYRGDKSRSRNFGGTGLGLAISKTIVEAHGGELEVKSKIGVGTTFYIKVPQFE